MSDSRMIFLLLTALLLALLLAIAFSTYSKKNKKKFEEPKHRMLDDE